ncbi:hypothetical protein KPST380_660030 [Klebsiella pneumoniae subsp. pneumoniae BJ1-GA]|nr:hypothetical protein KPST380_660030 [Klebsiella pneumoniae subsp. pneumoniae BJ1-GA]
MMRGEYSPLILLLMLRLPVCKNHSHRHDTLQQKQPVGFYDAQSLPDYQEGPPNQPKVDLYELDQRDTPDHRHNHNICGDHHHLDREVS